MATAFEPLRPGAVAELLVGLEISWWIAGGWALDLAAGRTLRAHGDVDAAVLRRDQAELFAFLAGWDLRAAVADELIPWRGDPLELPVHAIWARRPGAGEGASWTCEFLLNEADGETWVYRRDARVTRPLAVIGGVRDGIPFLRPEIVLLYKSTDRSTAADRDRAVGRTLLEAEAAAWLAAATATAHPGA